MNPNHRTAARRKWAIFAGIFAGIVFGIYWIPLRAMDAAGIHNMWAVALFNAVSFVLVMPFCLGRWKTAFPACPRLHVNAALVGLAYVLYIGAFLYTEVIRVLALFYLMPVWGFLLARIVIKDPLTTTRWLAMILGMVGLGVICGGDQGLPIPRNAGDWMSLLSGMIWAGVSLSILSDRQQPVAYGINFLLWGTVWAAAAVLVMSVQGSESIPQWEQFKEVMPWLVPFVALIVVPAAFATMYAPSQLNPGLVGLLFMSEISVGTATAAWLSGEPFGIREAVGIVLITIAGVMEPVRLLAGARQAGPLPGKQPGP